MANGASPLPRAVPLRVRPANRSAHSELRCLFQNGGQLPPHSMSDITRSHVLTDMMVLAPYLTMDSSKTAPGRPHVHQLLQTVKPVIAKATLQPMVTLSGRGRPKLRPSDNKTDVFSTINQGKQLCVVPTKTSFY